MEHRGLRISIWREPEDMRLEAYNKRAHLALDPESTSCVFKEKINMTASNFDPDYKKAYSCTQTYTLTGYPRVPILFLHTAKNATADFSSTVFINHFVVVDSLVNTAPGTWELRLSWSKYITPPDLNSTHPARPGIFGTTSADADEIIADYTIYAFMGIDPELDVSNDPFVLRKDNYDVSFASSQKLLKGRAIYRSSVLSSSPIQDSTGWNTGALSGMALTYQDKKGSPQTMGTFSADDIAALKSNPFVSASGVSEDAIDALSTGGTLGISKPAVRLRVRSEVKAFTDISYGFQAEPTITVPPSVVFRFQPGGDMYWTIGQYYDGSLFGSAGAGAPQAAPSNGTNAWDIYITTRDPVSIAVNYGNFSFAADGYYFYASWRQEIRPIISIGPTHAIEAWVPVHTQLISEADEWIHLPANSYTDVNAFKDELDPLYSQNDCIGPTQNAYSEEAYGAAPSTSYIVIDGADYDT